MEKKQPPDENELILHRKKLHELAERYIKNYYPDIERHGLEVFLSEQFATDQQELLKDMHADLDGFKQFTREMYYVYRFKHVISHVHNKLAAYKPNADEEESFNAELAKAEQTAAQHQWKLLSIIMRYKQRYHAWRGSTNSLSLSNYLKYNQSTNHFTLWQKTFLKSTESPATESPTSKVMACMA